MQINMTFFGKILGYRDFTKREEIKKHICSNTNFNSNEDIDNAESIIFFKTKIQQTWLLVSNRKIYCVLDDITTGNFELRWSIERNNLINSNGKIILELYIDPNYKEKSGRIDFGQIHRGWLYSKSLYPDPERLRGDIHMLIELKMKE